jgi:hypothetical protein
MLFRKAAVLMVAVAVPAVAAPDDEASDRVLAPFATCRALPEPAQRGLCYDRAYDSIRAEMATGNVMISDAANRQAEFGLSSVRKRRSRPANASAPIPIAINGIDSTIVVTRPYGPDMFTFQLADGSVWRTADGGPDPQFPRGTKVHLKRVLLGGILLQPEHGHELKVIRIR